MRRSDDVSVGTEKEAKFKVGDRVRWDVETRGYADTFPEPGTIVAIDLNGRITVLWDDLPHSPQPLYASNLLIHDPSFESWVKRMRDENKDSTDCTNR